MKLKCHFLKYAAIGLFLLGSINIGLSGTNAGESGDAVPKYKKTSYKNESVELKNSKLQLKIFKRIGGWGWGEISTADGRLMAVLDHLGEIMLRDQDIPMRFEAENVMKKSGPEGESLVFNVRSFVVKEKLKGTSFEEWMSYPYDSSCIKGEVTITLAPDKPLLNLHYRLKSTGNYYAKYIRGPWLKVGEASFGTAKDDAIFPGVDWVINDEWSSGMESFKDPWALRVVPHPNKVSIPMMALSYKGTGIGMAWNPGQVASRWFNYRSYRPQPVFATPNFVERANNTLMGLMIPDATGDGRENEVTSSLPIELRIGQQINLDAEIWLSEGNSMSVVTDWVKRHGLPEVPAPKWDFRETLNKIAGAYNTNFWHEGEGFGIKQRAGDGIGAGVPEFLYRYIRENQNTELAKELQKKVDWCETKSGKRKSEVNLKEDLHALEKSGDKLLEIQREDGSFYFDPDGRHYGKDDFRVATSFIEPMGLSHDTALDICLLPAIDLIDIARKTGKKVYKDAAKKALEYCMNMTRPEGGDYWETPLHAPNLLAAGHAAIAYDEAYKLFGDDRYKQKSIYWLRSVLPFTHLWEPSDIKMLYNTKPCLCSSDWYFANWVRDHVQWEVLHVFAMSSSRGIKWDEVDPEIDWQRYYKGITTAAVRWLNVHTDNNWRPHNIPSTYEAYTHGDFDYCFPDTHNSTTGNYGGMFIMPEVIAGNIYSILDREKK